MVAFGMAAVTVTRDLETGVHADDDVAALERAIAAGDRRDAIARCARLYAKPLGRLCMALSGSQAEADELVQETLIAAYDAFAQYRGEGSVKSFVFGIARRTCARAHEKRARRDARLRLVPEEGQGADAVQLALFRERADRTRKALEELRPTEREAVVLRFQGELSFREVAMACGCDEAAARKRVSRALVRMRELLNDV